MNTTVIADRAINIFAPLANMKEPEEGRIQRRAASFLSMVQSFTVATREDYSLAAEELGGIKAAYKRFEDERTSFTGPLNKVLDALNAKFMPHLKTLKAAEQILKEKLSDFDDLQERIAAQQRREAERLAQLDRERLAEQARVLEEQAQAERYRVAAIEIQRRQAAAAEQARIDAQAQAAAAAGNAAAAAAAHSQALALAERNDAAAAAAAAAIEQAELIRRDEIAAVHQQQAVVMAAPTLAPLKVVGLSSAKGWDFEVTELEAAVKDIVLNQPQFIGLLLLDTVKVRALVKSLGNNLHIEGVRVFEKRTMRSAAQA